MTNYTVAAKRRSRKRKQPSDPPAYEPKGELLAPTPERMAKGDYATGDGNRVFTDRDASPLRRALRRGKLTPEQVSAGEWLEALYAAVMGSAGPRSCLDWQIPGHSGTESERAVLLEQKYTAARRCMGRARRVVHDVCILHEDIGRCRPDQRRYNLLCQGLDALDRYRNGA